MSDFPEPSLLHNPAEISAEYADSWKVYLLECMDSTYYCGVAKHLERRVAQHNGLLPGGAKYTRPRRPVKLLAFRICPDKRSAYRLESAVKSVPRGKKLGVLLTYEMAAGAECSAL